jgi:hypothetical protein
MFLFVRKASFCEGEVHKGRNSLLRASRLCANNKFCSSISVLDRKRIDVDLDPDLTFHFDAKLDPDPALPQSRSSH